MALPELTDEQRKEALGKAMEMRKERRALRDKLKDGKVAFSDAVKEDIAQRMRVRMLIESLPGYGKVKTENLMDEVGIDHKRRVQGLGRRQMAELIDVLG